MQSVASSFKQEAESIGAQVPQTTQRLAGLASNGPWPANAERDMHRLIRKMCRHVAIEPYYVQNVRTDSRGRIKVYEHAMLAPHELFACYYSASVEKFMQKFHIDNQGSIKDIHLLCERIICHTVLDLCICMICQCGVAGLLESFSS